MIRGTDPLTNYSPPTDECLHPSYCYGYYLGGGGGVLIIFVSN